MAQSVSVSYVGGGGDVVGVGFDNMGLSNDDWLGYPHGHGGGDVDGYCMGNPHWNWMRFLKKEQLHCSWLSDKVTQGSVLGPI